MDSRKKKRPSRPPRKLEKRDMASVAKLLKEKSLSKIVFMVGAGISTSAGIPDFRSPDTGLYSNLAKLDLPYAEAVFDIDYFRENPRPFYTLAEELYPGKYRPTKFHAFIKLLQDKEMLSRVFTQNIDTLERIAGVSEEKIVEAHGSFAKNSCIDCKKPYPKEDMEVHVKEAKIPRCLHCGGLVKPDIVFFGEGLPPRFFTTSMKDVPAADLVIIAGTSLTVQPFASLPYQATCPRVLFNMEQVGDLGEERDDVLYLGDCDKGVEELCKLCGWDKELQELYDTADVLNVLADLEIREEEPKSPKEEHNVSVQEALDKINDHEEAHTNASESTTAQNHSERRAETSDKEESKDKKDSKSETETKTQASEKKNPPLEASADSREESSDRK